MTTQELTKNETPQENGAIKASTAEEGAPRVWSSAPVDILEGDEAYLLIAEVPGVKKSGLDIQYTDGALRIEATRSVDTSTGWPTDFRRVIAVGQDVDVDRISAELEHGVLQVTLPKREAVKPRTIEIKVS